MYKVDCPLNTPPPQKKEYDFHHFFQNSAQVSDKSQHEYMYCITSEIRSAPAGTHV